MIIEDFKIVQEFYNWGLKCLNIETVERIKAILNLSEEDAAKILKTLNHEERIKNKKRSKAK